MVRTEEESERRRRKEKWQSFWCCRDQRRTYRVVQALAEKLEHTGPEPLLPKGKGTEPLVQMTDWRQSR